VKIYTKERCKWCTRIKALMKTRKIEYTEVQVADADFDSFKEVHGVSTVPQLYVGDTRIGGFDAAKQKFKRDFDFEELHRVTGIVTRNLDKVIDINFYPTEKTRRSNFLHRPIGIGVQGLADVFAMMDMPFDSPEARQLNKEIFETIYHASLRASCNIAVDRKEVVMEAAQHWDKSGRPTHERHMPVCMGVSCAEMEAVLDKSAPAGAYSSFMGSPASNGELQFDMWGVEASDRFDWKSLKEDIVEYGLRNSLLLAPMPTASTSQILGNNECFEPFTSNIYSRRTIAGDYVVVNRHLMEELESIGVWSPELKDMIVKNRGSVQDIDGIPDDIKQKFKIVWEIPMRALIDMAADRGAFICQSQSLNLWLEDPDYKTLTSMHFYSWKKGLKTGLYYLRRKPKHQPQQFTIAPPSTTAAPGADSPAERKGSDADEECLMCSA
jgi:ribonucleotide reductase alpha subunit